MGFEEVLESSSLGRSVRPHLEAAYEAARNAIDAELLELCRDRLAMLLDHRPTLDELSAHELAHLTKWSSSDRFDDVQRAALAFTEQFAIDVASMPDDQARTLREQLGDQGLVDFVHALLVVEQRMRLDLIWAGVL